MTLDDFIQYFKNGTSIGLSYVDCQQLANYLEDLKVTKKYTVMLRPIGDGHFKPDPDKELYSSYIYEDCRKFADEYMVDHFGFWNLLITHQELKPTLVIDEVYIKRG